MLYSSTSININNNGERKESWKYTYNSMHVMFNNQQVKQFIAIKAVRKGGRETNTKKSDDCNGGG